MTNQTEYYANGNRKRDFTMHDRSLHLTIARNEEAPNWLRVAHYCYAMMDSNGRYDPRAGELVELLGMRDSRNVSHYVSKAVKCGLLEEGSRGSRLVAPGGVEYRPKKWDGS